MNIGLILTQYNEKSFVEKCLAPWIEFKENSKEHELLIICLDGCFYGNEVINNSTVSTDGSLEILKELKNRGKIDFLETFTNQPRECEARTIGSDWALKQGVSACWLLGVDEFYQVGEIEKAIKFIENNPFTVWFRIEFKNLVFSDKQYIRGFNPGRVFRTSVRTMKRSLKLGGLYGDDDFYYLDDNGNQIDCRNLCCSQIPFAMCSPLHESWIDSERSRKKVIYQKSIWGANGCSFDWISGHLVFNKSYYQKNNISIPEVFRLNE